MFYEIAITPSVFKTECYASRELCDSEIRGIWTELNNCLVVRDLRGGDWFKELWARKTESPHFAQKALKSLRDGKRLRSFPISSGNSPSNSGDWCREALSSHTSSPLDGILSCAGLKPEFRDESLVCAINNRHGNNTWWTKLVVDGPSRVPRYTAGYLSALGVLLRSANHLMIMDPHLDPAHHDYREFKQILLSAHRSDGVQPTIEIHRVSYLGVGRQEFPSNHDWEERFKTALKSPLERVGLDAEVFIWPDEHDRHIISNLGGIHMGNGLKINNDPNDTSTWTRLPPRTAESVQRQFDPSVNRPRHRFHIVKSG
jgi:hypothetical protein